MAIAAGAILVTTGVGFAAFTATATVHGTATPASFGLVITSVSEAAGAPWVVITTTALPAPIVSVWVNDTSDSSRVDVKVVVQNIGSVPADDVAYAFSTSLSGPSSCSNGTYMYPAATNIPAGDTLAPGASFPSYWEFQAGPDLSDCAGATYFHFTISWTANSGA
ncbi:MAG TPA: hypothetical protein VMG36_04215 [Thermoplasmata archaeon]|nr:hypothetical protein [Thermoplasmata archaeon]